MPFFYSLAGEQLDLTLSTEDKAERLEQSGVEHIVLRSAQEDQTSLSTTRRHREAVRVSRPRDGRSVHTRSMHYRRLIHAEERVESSRPLPVYRDPRSGLCIIATEEITVRFKAQVSKTQQEKLLRARGLVMVRENFFVPRQYIVAPTNAIEEIHALDLANRLREADELVEFSAPNFVSEHSKAARTNDRVADALRYASLHAQILSCDVGRRTSYSNFGPGLDFMAPSGDTGRAGITTTDVSHRRRGFSLNRLYTDTFTGTSAATPLAAGIGALVLTKQPNLRWDEVRDLLQSTADKVTPIDAQYDAQGYSLKYGYGRLNAYRAVSQV